VKLGVPVLGALGWVLASCVGCAGPVAVTQVVDAADAPAYRSTKLHPTAIVRGGARAALPPDAVVDKTEVRIPQNGTFEYPLDPGETVERDRVARVTEVRGAGHPPIRFVPATTSFDGSVVRGELEGHLQRVPLVAGDKIEIGGTLAPGDLLPYGGSVDASRAWTALVFGAVILAGGWFPSIYVAASSSVGSDGWLAVPAFGPWIALAARPECVPDPSTPIPTCLDDGTARIALIADGILQTAGLGLLVFGIPTHTEVTWRGETDAEPKKSVKFDVTPMVGRTNGLSLRLTF
jgi:hypothetical protein